MLGKAKTENRGKINLTMGLFLILLTGLVWGGIGIVLGLVARRRLNALAFLTVAGLLGAAGSWLVLVHWPSLLTGRVERGLPLVALLSIAGITGTLGMLALQKAMTAGAAAWTVGQSAMVIPFLFCLLFLGEPLSRGGALGLLAILSSLGAFAASNRQETAATQNWLRPALLALVLLGIQQTLCSIPSSWPGWSDTARLRVPLVLSTGVLPLVVLSLRRRLWPQRAAWILALAYATLVILGQLLLFTALDLLSHEGRLALAFPLALGACMLVVTLCDILVWKNRPNRFAVAGLAFGLLGVILLAC